MEKPIFIYSISYIMYFLEMYKHFYALLDFTFSKFDKQYALLGPWMSRFHWFFWIKFNQKATPDK